MELFLNEGQLHHGQRLEFPCENDKRDPLKESF